LTTDTDVKRPRVVIADDDVLIRFTIRRIIESDFDVVAEAANGREAVEVVETVQPDVVLLDISMPKMNGLEAAAFIKERHPRITILMVSSYSSPVYTNEARRRGASGYVVKGAGLLAFPTR